MTGICARASIFLGSGRLLSARLCLRERREDVERGKEMGGYLESGGVVG